EERDLLVGEPANLLAEYIDSANQRPFLEHRYKNNCANPQEIDEVHGSYIALAIRRNRAKIIDLHHLLRSNHFSMAAPRTGTECPAPPRLGICRRNIVKRTGNLSPSYRFSVPNFASQSRAALANMVSNTGSSPPGELLMTCRTSEVAVCWA